MSREVTVVSPDATVLSAAQTMSQKNVSCIVVADDRQVVGILTETDFLIRIAGKDRDFYQIPVGRIFRKGRVSPTVVTRWKSQE